MWTCCELVEILTSVLKNFRSKHLGWWKTYIEMHYSLDALIRDHLNTKEKSESYLLCAAFNTLCSIGFHWRESFILYLSVYFGLKKGRAKNIKVILQLQNCPICFTFFIEKGVWRSLHVCCVNTMLVLPTSHKTELVQNEHLWFKSIYIFFSFVIIFF